LVHSRKSVRFATARWPILAALVVAALVLAGCGNVAPPRGWAGPVALSSSGDERVVVIQTQPGRLTAIALTPAGASERWKFPADGDKFKLGAIYATPILDGPRLIVLGFSGDVLALDPASGRPIIGWGGKVRGKVVADPVFNSAHDILFVATDHGAIHPVSVGSGAVFPSRTTEQLRMFGSGVAVASEVVYGSLDRRLFAIEDSSGAVIWSVPAAPLLGDLAAVEDRVVAGTVGGRVTAYQASDGSERWSFQAGAWVWARPLAAGNTLYVADLDGIVYALDNATGAERWRTTTPRGDVRGNLALTSGLLVMASSSGSIFALDPASGVEQWHIEPGVGRLLASPLVLESDILFLSDSGTLLRVQPITGTYETLYQRN
jgi:outer membrane protein assembly factor BamB